MVPNSRAYGGPAHCKGIAALGPYLPLQAPFRPHSSGEQHTGTGNNENSNRASACGNGTLTPADHPPDRRFQGRGSNPVGGTTAFCAFLTPLLASGRLSGTTSERPGGPIEATSAFASDAPLLSLVKGRAPAYSEGMS